MPKFTLVCDHSCDLDTHVVTHQFNAEHIDDVIMNMESFLRGAGYFFDGQLMIDDPKEVQIDLSSHSQHYFDTGRNR